MQDSFGKETIKQLQEFKEIFEQIKQGMMQELLTDKTRLVTD